jgi:hypothetical protein
MMKKISHVVLVQSGHVLVLVIPVTMFARSKRYRAVFVHGNKAIKFPPDRQ